MSAHEPNQHDVNQHDVLEKLEAGLRTASAQGRLSLDTPGFQVFIATDSDNEHMSLAVPRGPAPGDWRQAVAALRRAFERHGRRPRLEFFAELHPTLAPALEELGFARQMSAPVMVLTEAALSNEAPALLEANYRRLGQDAALEPFLRAQHLAYAGTYGGEDERALDWLPGLRRGLASGAVMAAALEQAGDMVAGASIMMAEGVGELAGVWTLPSRRRQGLAYGLCRSLLAGFFASGGTLCWLSAAEGALGLYQKLGFEEVGTQLNYGLKRS